MSSAPLHPVPTRHDSAPGLLHPRVVAALEACDVIALATLPALEPCDERDELLALLAVVDLHLAPLDQVGPSARLQHHPDVARLKHELEDRFLQRLRERTGPTVGFVDGNEAVGHVRAIAAVDAVPPVYEWLAERASPDEVRRFLELEGGPDGGFDDFVAISQVGLSGEPKLELATNYWDEMGRGAAGEVHTELQRRMSEALALQAGPREHQPVEALARAALGPVLATNRWLQPELIGALGLLELQAGPRCRKVVTALRRLDGPADALPFYDEHARTDPRHGKDWLDRVIAPLAHDRRWASGIVRGAHWRSTVNRRFFDAMVLRLDVNG
jgi:hypothetical protein